MGWSRRRRAYERWTNWYTEGVTEPTWGEATYESSTSNSLESSYIGGHDINTVTYTSSQSSSIKRKKQTITYDCLVHTFAIPSTAVSSATISIYFRPQTYNDTIRVSRITAAVPSAGYPNVTSTHRVSVSVPKAGGWVEIDVTQLINDAISAGQWYGLWFDTSSIWTSRKTIFDFNQVILGGGISEDKFNAHVTVGGVAKKVKAAKILVNGVWKKVKSMKKI